MATVSPGVSFAPHLEKDPSITTVEGEFETLSTEIQNDKLVPCPFAQDDPTLTLTEQQQVVCDLTREWLKTPHDKYRVIVGFAGTGKSFTVAETLRPFQQDLAEGFRIIGTAPTHDATRELKESSGGVFDDYRTIYSLLALRLEDCKFTKKEDSELSDLLKLGSNASKDQELRLSLLQHKKHLTEQGTQQLQPSDNLDLENIRLVIVDECSLINEFLFYQIFRAIEHPTAHPDLQFLFLGDPFQTPPIGEVKSKAFQLECFPALTEVVRYDGKILEYATALRDRPVNLSGLHHTYANLTPEFGTIPFCDAIREGAKLFKQGENLRFISATNARVDEINYMLRRQIKGSGNLGYSRGDLLITKSSVMRRNCRPMGDGTCTEYGGEDSYCWGCKKKVKISTSTLIRVVAVTGEETFTTALGTQFTRYKCTGELYSTRQAIDTPLRLIDPEDLTSWRDECSQLLQWAKSTQSRGKTAKNARGQTGKYAKQVWEKYGLKNWSKRLDGSDFEDQDYRRLRSRLWNNFTACVEAVDPVQFSYCTTIHKIQGASIDTVVIDVESVVKSLAYQPRSGRGEDLEWDPWRLLYTAATRARKQLIFIE